MKKLLSAGVGGGVIRLCVQRTAQYVIKVCVNTVLMMTPWGWYPAGVPPWGRNALSCAAWQSLVVDL